MSLTGQYARRLPGGVYMKREQEGVDGSNMTLMTVGSVPNTTMLLSGKMVVKNKIFDFFLKCPCSQKNNTVLKK